MSDEFNKIEAQLEQIREELKQINLVLGENTGNLKLHMYRTKLNEKRLELIEEKTLVALAEVKAEMKPVVEHVNQLRLLGKWSVRLAMALGAILGSLKVILEISKLLH